MKQRIHYHPATERRMIHGVLWFALACIVLIALTSCSPYVTQPGTPTTTPSPAATVTALPTMTDEATPAPAACTVTGYLNFRTAPSRTAAVIRVLIAGETVTVISRGAWLEVIAQDGRQGFIYSRYCHE